MIGLRRAFLLALPAFLLSLPPSAAATVKKASGEILEGEIQGVIVQKSGARTLPVYRLRKGGDIAAIDEAGVHLRPGSRETWITFWGEPASDLDALAGRIKTPFPRVGGTSETSLDPSPILGEFTGEGANAALLTEISLLVGQETLKVPVTELVPFTKKGPEPSPKLKR